MRRALIVAAAAIAVLAAGHTALWAWAVNRLETESRAWAAARQAQGWEVRIGPSSTGGWPWAARLHIEGVAVAAKPPASAITFAYTAGAADLDIALLRPASLRIRFAGAQSIRLGPTPALPFTAASTDLVVPFSAGGPVHEADLTATDLLLGPDKLPVGRLALHTDLHPTAAAGEPAIAFTLAAGPVELARTAAAATLGGNIERIEAEGALSGPLPRLPDPAARAAAWRDGGGSLTFTRIALTWGKLTANASATIALDEKLQPMGTATARLSGADAALDSLAGAHAIAPQAGFAGKALLGLMSQPQPDGTSVVDVPLTLKDRTLMLGRLPLARLPEMTWPKAP